MKRLATLALALACQCALSQDKVDASGLSSAVKLEQVLSGHVADLNGKFKIRVTEVTFAPGARLGAHHHAGPGIRLVLSGELAFLQGGKTIVYRAGDYFYEPGNMVHTAQNRTREAVRVAFVEVLPVRWTGPSLIPPVSYGRGSPPEPGAGKRGTPREPRSSGSAPDPSSK